LSSAYC